MVEIGEFSVFDLRIYGSKAKGCNNRRAAPSFKAAANSEYCDSGKDKKYCDSGKDKIHRISNMKERSGLVNERIC